MSFPPDVSLIIPVYNEEENLPRLLHETISIMQAQLFALLGSGNRDNIGFGFRLALSQSSGQEE
jgi:cellulose synthase/poly-beta-1,6-N-acetylglucosamine synthase-like glycosyltransferase